MEKICLSQNNFDILLKLALSNCQKSEKKTHIKRSYKPISFLNEPESLQKCLDSNGFYDEKIGKCVHIKDGEVYDRY